MAEAMETAEFFNDDEGDDDEDDEDDQQELDLDDMDEVSESVDGPEFDDSSVCLTGHTLEFDDSSLGSVCLTDHTHWSTTSGHFDFEVALVKCL